ncbi:hypothetical protein JW933_08940 [candidate division FCPU426 bacterium]|nr:hypothetical protein [candidate division FCPU426 bacterium]
MKFLWPLAVLIILAAGAYYTLRFFTRLAEVDMLAALSWGFKARRFELVLTFFLFYIMAAVMYLAVAQRPLLILEVKNYHVGGLTGCRENEYLAKVYDPFQGKYIEYEHYTPPPAAGKFTETFEVVSFYKPFAASHYQNVQDLSLPVTLILIFIGTLGLVLMYLVLFALAGEYIKAGKVPNALTHAFIFSHFQKVTGLPFFKTLILLLAALAIISALSDTTVRGIMHRYREDYLQYQERMRGDILRKVSPRAIVRGRLLRRFHSLEKVYQRPNYQDRRETRYYHVSHYTVEFNQLTQVPVYLELALCGEAGSNAAIQMLDTFFPDDKAVMPDEKKELDFMVNDDYSVSLWQEADSVR